MALVLSVVQRRFKPSRFQTVSWNGYGAPAWNTFILKQWRPNIPEHAHLMALVMLWSPMEACCEEFPCECGITAHFTARLSSPLASLLEIKGQSEACVTVTLKYNMPIITSHLSILHFSAHRTSKCPTNIPGMFSPRNSRWNMRAPLSLSRGGQSQ